MTQNDADGPLVSKYRQAATRGITALIARLVNSAEYLAAYDDSFGLAVDGCRAAKFGRAGSADAVSRKRLRRIF
jgi:hypothetical protein